MKRIKILTFSLILTSNLFSMEKQLSDAVYQKLTSAVAQERSNGLLLIFNYQKQDLNNIKAILAKENTLTYLGILSKSLTSELFDFFKAGTFVFDYNNAMVKGPLIIIGTETMPTSKEFTEMCIPADKLEEITDAETAQAFKTAITSAQTRDNLDR